MQQKEEQRWSLKKEVSIGDLVAFAVAMSSVVYAYTTLETRIQMLERENITMMKANTRQDEDTAQLKKDIKDDLQRINDKLDRLMWRGASNRG